MWSWSTNVTDRRTDGQTDRRTDGQHAISIPRYALVHRAVKIVHVVHCSVCLCVLVQIFYINHSANFFLYCITGQRFRQAMWSLCRCRISEFDRFSSDPAIAYLATLARSRNSPSPALKQRKAVWGSTPALNYLTPTGQLQNKMITDPIHRKSSPALFINVLPSRRESIVWVSCSRVLPVAVLCWGQGAQPPKSCPGPPKIFNWFYSNFA